MIVTLAARKIPRSKNIEFRIVGATTGPRLRTVPPPRYPPAALHRRIVGGVLLRIDVGIDGNVKSAAVERSNTSHILENAALQAVRKWTFVPESVGGEQMAATVLVPINFCIAGRPCKTLDPQACGKPDPAADKSCDQPRLVGDPAVRIKTAVATL